MYKNNNLSFKDSTKHDINTVLLIAFSIFICVSLLIGMSELFFKILPDFVIDFLEHLGEQGNETGMVYGISMVLSLLCFYFMYMGYKQYREGFWGEGLPGKRILEPIDRDKLICKLEKKFNLLKEINKIIENTDNEHYSDELDELVKIKEQLSAIIDFREERKGNI